MRNKPKKVYVICYIDQENYHLIQHQLISRGYEELKAFIPTVKLVEKSRGGTVHYKTVPLLFSYGFIKMPREMAYDRHALIKLRKSIPGIRTFLRSNENLFKKKIKRRIDNTDDWDDFSQVAICPKVDIRRFKKMSHRNKIFTLENMIDLNPGDYLVLNTYPYMGIESEVIEVDYLKKLVKLKLFPELGRMEVNLPLEEVLYSVYKNCNPDKLLTKKLRYERND